MKNINAYLILLLFFFASDIFAQATFQKFFTTNSNGIPSVSATTDGGYAILGDLLIKTDGNGDTTWTKIFNFGTGIGGVQTFDGGYAVAGYTNMYGAGNTDFYLVKTDSAGNPIWSNTYGDTLYNEAYAIQQTSDSGFILAGNTLGLHGYDFLIVRTKPNGDTLWTKMVGESGEDKANAICKTSDGKFVIAGHTTSFGSNGPDAYAVMLDASGNVIRSKTYNGPGGEFVNSIIQTSEGGFMMTGFAVNFTTTNHDLFLIKTDSALEVSWSRFYTSTNDFGSSVAQTNDGGYIITGNSSVLTGNGQDVNLIKTDSAGNFEWMKSFGSTGLDEGTSIIATIDGGYMAVGRTNSVGTGYFFGKTDSLGDSGCNQNPINLMENDSLVTDSTVISWDSSGTIITNFNEIPGSGVQETVYCSTVGVKELPPDGAINIFPNPATGHITIVSEEISIEEKFEIYSLIGERVFSGIWEKGANQDINLSFLRPGIYFLIMKTGKNLLKHKLIIE